MDRGHFYHWGATSENMEIRRGGNNSPKTRRKVEQRFALSRPGKLRSRYDPRTQRTVFVTSRQNKRSREKLQKGTQSLQMQRANRLGSGYRLIVEEKETENPEEGEVEPVQAEAKEEKRKTPGDNLSIVD